MSEVDNVDRAAGGSRSSTVAYIGKVRTWSDGIDRRYAQLTPLYLSAHLARSSLYDCVSAIAIKYATDVCDLLSKAVCQSSRVLELFVLAKQPCIIGDPG
jgi:hypothetical protein